MAEFETVTLLDPSSSLTAVVVPQAGMIVSSLADGDDEFLGQRRGLDAYLSDGKTMGIPILYPWANRLSDNTYRVDDTAVTLVAGTNGVRVDGHAPIHGVLAAYPGWKVTARSADSLTAVLDYADDPALLASFPFPHVLTQRVTLGDRTLSFETTVTPTTDVAVPLCFGYHPYLRIPGVARTDWLLQTPTMRHLPVDAHGLPTGAVEPWPESAQPLGDASYDDGFDQVPEGAVFALSGGNHRIEVHYASGYPAAQIFAPLNDDVVGIEPMAAQTNSLVRGGYRSAAAGEPAILRFSITVI